MRIFSTTHDTVYKVEILLLPIVKSGGQKGTPLTCKELQRSRRAKMKDMMLWEKRAILREQKAKIDFGSIEDL